jgi:hypothetical protein
MGGDGAVVFAVKGGEGRARVVVRVLQRKRRKRTREGEDGWRLW